MLDQIQIPTVMPTDNRPRNRGKSLNDDTSRLDGVAKVTGRAKYGRDRFLPNSLYAAFVRCPWGAGELQSHDADAAKAVKGVVEVEISPRACRYHGQNVGYIAAESPLALKRGLRALACKWKRGSVKTKIADDLGDPAAATSDTDELLKKSAHVLDAVYSTQVQTHTSLETHGAAIDHKGEEAVVYASTQGTFSAIEGLEEPLGLPRSKFKVVCEFVGGGFGSKLGGAGKESALAAQIAAKHKRPCYCFCNREEEHLDTGNRPSSRTHFKVGCEKDGTILGGFVQTWGGVGAARGGGGVTVPSERYNLGNIQKARHTDVQFNAGTPRAMRAPGRPQGTFAEELMIDEVAALAGVDPLTVRINHARHPDSRKMLEMGAGLIGWKNRQPNGSQKAALRRGFGIGLCGWGRGRQQSEAEVVINHDGSVLCKTGSQDIGTGQRTCMAIVAAESLGVPLKVVQVMIGDSTLPVAPGSGGSVTLTNTAPSMAAAAKDAREKLLKLVADANQIDVGELQVKDRQISRNGQQVATWEQACAKIGPQGVVGRGSNEGRPSGHSEGAQFVDLRVDTETGVVYVDRVVAIQACGKVVCRKTAESQIIGAVIQGLSFGLFEDRLLDRHTGAMVNPNMEWYRIAGSNDMPRIEPVLWDCGPDAGVMPLGEPPVIPTAGAIACAIFNAIGKPVRSLPMTPDKLLAAMSA